jgi:hypothetical protein
MNNILPERLSRIRSKNGWSAQKTGILLGSTDVNLIATPVAAATSDFQEEKLRAETEKFRVGKSTSLLVGQAQRDFVASQIAQTQAVANHLKALITLYRLEGSLLQRRGVSAPGDTPVNLDLGD